MSYQVKAYRSVAELLGSVTTEIEQTRKELRRVLEACLDVRKRSDRAKRLQQAFLNGSQQSSPTASKGVRFGELDVVVNAGADDALLALELMGRAQNSRLAALQKIRETLTKLEARGQREVLDEIACLVIENDGVPRKLMFQDKHHFESAAMSSLFPSTMQGLAAGTDHGPIPEQSRIVDVEQEMTSIAHENTGQKHSEAEHVAVVVDRSEATPANSDGILGNVFRFVTAKPVHN